MPAVREVPPPMIVRMVDHLEDGLEDPGIMAIACPGGQTPMAHPAAWDRRIQLDILGFSPPKFAALSMDGQELLVPAKLWISIHVLSDVKMATPAGLEPGIAHLKGECPIL